MQDAIQPNFDRDVLVSRIFTPATPVGESALFAGRMDQLRKVIDTINQRGRHSIIFGERGVGKTSLASVISSRLSAPNTKIVAPRINCDSGDTYASLWRKVFSQIDLISKTPAIGFQLTIFTESIKAGEVIGDDVNPDEVRRLLFLLAETGLLIIVFDEFDRITDEMTRRMMADTIKALSDHSVDVTVVIVGVADSVEDLISQHASVERALVQVKMPPMSVGELEQVVSNGMIRLKMEIEDEAKSQLALLCQGFPHYAHLMGLHSTRTCLDRDSLKVTVRDVQTSIQTAIADMDQTILSVYDKAVFSPQKDTLHVQVLLACALAETVEFGYFTAASIRDPLSDITGRRYEIPGFSRHLKDFSGEGRGRILRKEGEARKFRFRFRNPLMRPLIIMKGIADGILDTELLARYS